VPDYQVPAVEYEATIDECVDSILRAYRSTDTHKRVRNRDRLWVGGPLALAMIYGMVREGNWSAYAFEIAIPLGLVTGGIAALLWGPVHDHIHGRNVRRFVDEKVKGVGTLRSRVEVRPDCLWMHSSVGDLSVPWPRVNRVEETPAGIDIWLAPSNLCALPSRAFHSPPEMQLFANALKRHIVEDKKEIRASA
jgi:hypothetical protein